MAMGNVLIVCQYPSSSYPDSFCPFASASWTMTSGFSIVSRSAVFSSWAVAWTSTSVAGSILSPMLVCRWQVSKGKCHLKGRESTRYISLGMEHRQIKMRSLYPTGVGLPQTHGLIRDSAKTRLPISLSVYPLDGVEPMALDDSCTSAPCTSSTRRVTSCRRSQTFCSSLLMVSCLKPLRHCRSQRRIQLKALRSGIQRHWLLWGRNSHCISESRVCS